MQVSDELRKALHEAVVVALNAYAEEEDVDKHLTDAVVEVIEEIPEQQVQDAPLDFTPVKYIGHRQEYSDGLFETGVWQKGETRLIPKSTAGKMLVHKSVYIPGEMADVSGEPLQEREDDGDESDELREARDAIYQMTRKAQVKEFVSDNFGGMKVDLPQRANLDEFKQFAIRQVDIQRLP